jgi:predicted nucleotide-binding protein
MIERFEGDANRRRRLEAIKKQRIVRNDERLAEEIEAVMKLIEFGPGERFIAQNADDDDLYLILAGKVSAEVNGREVAIMGTGQQVGEMAVIDEGARRSASVYTLEQTVLGIIPEAAFIRIANAHPSVWRELACQLGERIRERNDLVVARNPRPVVFIGSSAERIDVLRALENAFAHDHKDFIVRSWTEPGAFRASKFPIESLEVKLRTSDFAVLLVEPDDVSISRGAITDSPRDNVIFELGLFMGALTRHRTFLVVPSKVDLKIPSDLFGMTPLVYETGEADTLAVRIAPVANQLRELIKEKGAK